MAQRDISRINGLLITDVKAQKEILDLKEEIESLKKIISSLEERINILENK